MSRLVLVDGNSIMNRAFYGIMSSKMLTTSDGTYTNAVYGFLAILFKIEEVVMKVNCKASKLAIIISSLLFVIAVLLLITFNNSI